MPGMDQTLSVLATYLADVLPMVLPKQAPVNESPLAALARKQGGANTGVQKVTITGGEGPGLKHGARYQYSPESGPNTLVWDAVRGTWVKRAALSPLPESRSIESVKK